VWAEGLSQFQGLPAVRLDPADLRV
jgi:hypothetical protein